MQRFTSKTDDDFLRLTLDAGRWANALDIHTLQGLKDAILDEKNREKMIIISAEGDVFSAGLDLKQIQESGKAGELLRCLRDLYLALIDHPAATVCLVSKQAAAGGVGLALCADVVIMTCEASLALPSDPVYRPLANYLFPIVKATRSVERSDFDSWFGGRVNPYDLKKRAYIDKVIHSGSIKRREKRLQKAAMNLLCEGKLYKEIGIDKTRSKPAKEELQRSLEVAIQACETPAFLVGVRATLGEIVTDPQGVFIVHGRDMKALRSVQKLLELLSLRQIELKSVREMLGGATLLWDTIYTGLKVAQVVIVILTGDDDAKLLPDSASQESSQLRQQPRPNVFLEAGVALGMFPHRTILLKYKSAEVPSDLAGHYYVKTGGQDDWRECVADLLRAADCQTTMPREEDPFRSLCVHCGYLKGDCECKAVSDARGSIAGPDEEKM